MQRELESQLGDGGTWQFTMPPPLLPLTFPPGWERRVLELFDDCLVWQFYEGEDSKGGRQFNCCFCVFLVLLCTGLS